MTEEEQKIIDAAYFDAVDAAVAIREVAVADAIIVALDADRETLDTQKDYDVAYVAARSAARVATYATFRRARDVALKTRDAARKAATSR